MKQSDNVRVYPKGTLMPSGIPYVGYKTKIRNISSNGLMATIDALNFEGWVVVYLEELELCSVLPNLSSYKLMDKDYEKFVSS